MEEAASPPQTMEDSDGAPADLPAGPAVRVPLPGSPAAKRQLRLRRVRSTSRAQEIVTEDEKLRRAQPDKPIHKPKDSLLSWSSGFQHYEGIMNWAFLILCIGGVRLFLENLNKYGVRVDPTIWLWAVFGNIVTDTGEYPLLQLFICEWLINLAYVFLAKILTSRVISIAVHNDLDTHCGEADFQGK